MAKKAGQLWIVSLSEALSNRIAVYVEEWNFAHRKEIGSQLIRAADSVSANLVEGFGRHHPADSLRLYYISRGSLEETLSWIRKAKIRKLISDFQANDLLLGYYRLAKGLNAFMRSTRAKIKPPLLPIPK
jgi:four helix bundle protein